MIDDRYGPWAVVTGASSGLGSEFTRHLARQGLDVVLAARWTDRLEALAVDRGGGGLLLVSALGAPEGIPHMADAAGAKAAVASLGESLHHELSPQGVRVTVMLPGNVDTPILQSFAMDRDHLPLSPLPVEHAVAEAIDALVHGRSRVVPDWRMRWLSRVTPRSVLVRLNGRMMGRAADALAARETVETPQVRP